MFPDGNGNSYFNQANQTKNKEKMIENKNLINLDN
jgi:hypothetical protein